ncbi:hypothetical protein J1N35_044393 [Gossypium stocksii]|uniref:Uncharacterized protein n=1 Tax=Gossypium stocksii TaxID=47602 RepID=A0A9D3U9A9_9ROSI|nr:hypothetical protein J1N35_044393 [Gossypium stocksii]
MPRKRTRTPTQIDETQSKFHCEEAKVRYKSIFKNQQVHPKKDFTLKETKILANVKKTGYSQGTITDWDLYRVAGDSVLQQRVEESKYPEEEEEDPTEFEPKQSAEVPDKVELMEPKAEPDNKTSINPRAEPMCRNTLQPPHAHHHCRALSSTYATAEHQTIISARIAPLSPLYMPAKMQLTVKIGILYLF